MSEHLPLPEKEAFPPHAPERQIRGPSEMETKAAPHEPDAISHSVEALQQTVETQAKAAQEAQHAHTFEQPNPHILGVHQQLKSDAYNRTLHRTRHHLSRPEQVLSKLVHHPMVEPITEASAKTLGRPSGILGGACLALIGSSCLLYIAKHYGFTYNYGVFFLLFIVGFGLGLLAELGIKLISRRR